ncbi:MAG: hypothetical protein ACSHWU_04160 [Marinicella sp.]
MKNTNFMLKTVGLGASLLLIQSVGMAKEDVVSGGTGGSITAGTATHAVNNYDQAGHSGTDMVGYSAAVTGDSLWNSGWFFRVSGDSREFSFGAPDSDAFGGDVGVMEWQNVAGRNLFSAEYVVQVAQDAADSATLTKTMFIRNLSGGTLDIEIFHYEDIDAGGTFGDDTADITNSPDFISVTDAGGLSNVEYRGGGNTSYQVTVFGAITDLLNDDAITDFDNSGLPFAQADYSGGMQWSQSLPEFGTLTIQSTTGFGIAAPVPQEMILIDDVIWRNGFEVPIAPPVR